MNQLLFLTWQSDKSQRIYPVGRLKELEQGRYRFEYLRAVSEAQKDGFLAFPSFPELSQAYDSPGLPAMFRNRIMSPKREDYPQYLRRLGLTNQEPSPMEQLGASCGLKVTDALELFTPPVSTGGGQLVRCFVRGIRYKEGAEDAIACLLDQAELRVSWVPGSRHAVHLLGIEDRPLGYLPNYLTKELYDHRASSNFSDLLTSLKVTVVQVNKEPSPVQQRLKVQVFVPTGALKMGLFEFQPFSE